MPSQVSAHACGSLRVLQYVVLHTYYICDTFRQCNCPSSCESTTYPYAVKEKETKDYYRLCSGDLEALGIPGSVRNQVHKRFFTSSAPTYCLVRQHCSALSSS